MDHGTASTPAAGPSSLTTANTNTTTSSSSHPLSPLKFPLSKRTSSRHALNTTYLDGVPAAPSTPLTSRRRTSDKSQGKGKKPAREQGTTRKEQLKGQHIVEAYSARHSHGLSWSSTTRDSVVDNLLLSLDNLSTHNVPGMSDGHDDDFERERRRMPPVPQLPQYPTTKPGSRTRGHTYSSSMSSGYDAYAAGSASASPASKYSSSTKGRRSNSSSNFGPMPRTISERTQPARAMNGSTRISSDTLRRLGTHTKDISSDLDSMDYEIEEETAATGRQNMGGRRSMSMDQIYVEPPSVQSVLARGRPVPSLFSKYEANFDAAPEPGVPAGPRKQQNPGATGPVYVNAAPSKGPAVRKTNTQSDLRNANKPIPPIPQYIQEQASDFVRENSMRSMPQIPLSIDHNTRDPSPGLQAARNSNAPSPQRERPGFFKRFFGPGSRTASGLSHASDPGDSYTYLDKVAPPMRKESLASVDPVLPNKTEIRAVPKEHSATASHPPPSLNKKPSSFFRRRKKSTSEILAPPPPLPALTNSNLTKAQLSPSISSLRQVMDPYLADEGTPKKGGAASGDRLGDSSRPTTGESVTTDSDSLDMFHFGYTPPPDASLGRRDPMRRELGTKGGARQDHREESPRMPIKVKKRKPAPVEPVASKQGDTFLHDASRETSTATIGDHFVAPMELPRVSPMTEAPPDVADDERPVSRASTGDMIIAAKALNATQPADDVRNFSGTTDISQDGTDSSWIQTHPPRGDSMDRPGSKRSERLILRPTEAEERNEDGYGITVRIDHSRNTSRTTSSKSPLPHQGFVSAMHSPATVSVYHSTTSLPLPSVQVEGNEIPRPSIERRNLSVSSPLTDRPKDYRPSFEQRKTSLPVALVDEDAEYKERARKIYEGDEEDVMSSEAAAWLGERNTLSTRTLNAYMKLFDFTGMNLLSALRTLCGKLLLKGETQQFDRIITELSTRWCECNPRHGFKAQDVVHTIFYSLVLLNTDLHMADIGEKMSRSAYVKNTLPTIRRVVSEAAPHAFDDNTIKPTSQASRPSHPWADPNGSGPNSPTFPPHDTPNGERTSIDAPRPAAYKRLSLRPGMLRSDSDGWAPDAAGGNASTALVNQPWRGPLRGWEFEVETVLKSFYASIQKEPLPLLGAPEAVNAERNLSVANFTGLKRSGSVVSRAPSENVLHRKPNLRAMTMGWQSKVNRSRPKLYPASTLGSSRTSFDDSNSVWSPAQSSTWSKNSFAKTLTSTSMTSLGYHLTPSAADYKHSIGFANALSQAIIREEAVGGSNGETESISMPAGLLEDEALALEGAPWAKEGLVKHKHHLETPGRKARERSWNDCFAVLSKGKLTLFAFNTSTKSHSLGRKAHAKQANGGGAGGRAASIASTKVGGGDWMENAEQIGSFILRQTIASTLPSPGYSKARPHVWALSLPSGAVHLFQVGTPDIAQEFMTTANYWSARLSKEPLSGGVSNVEYGWSDQVINTALLEQRTTTANNENTHPTSPPVSINNVAAAARGHMHSSSGTNMPRPSFQSSLRGSFDASFGGGSGNNPHRTRLPGDKAQIADWQQPTQSMMASQLLEIDQLRALTNYVNNVEAELATHNELKHAIDLAYSPRHANSHKALANWQRKSDYLLREIVKFRTYIDSLSAAQKAKEAFYTKREEKAEAVNANGAAVKGAGNVAGLQTTLRAEQAVE